MELETAGNRRRAGVATSKISCSTLNRLYMVMSETKITTNLIIIFIDGRTAGTHDFCRLHFIIQRKK
jgi:hypothetical protein